MKTHKDGDMRVVRKTVGPSRAGSELQVGYDVFVTLEEGQTVVTQEVFRGDHYPHWGDGQVLDVEDPPPSAWERFKAWGGVDR